GREPRADHLDGRLRRLPDVRRRRLAARVRLEPRQRAPARDEPVHRGLGGVEAGDPGWRYPETAAVKPSRSAREAFRGVVTQLPTRLSFSHGAPTGGEVRVSGHTFFRRTSLTLLPCVLLVACDASP